MKIHQNIRFKFLLCLILISVLPTMSIFLYTLHNYGQLYTNQIESVSNSQIRKVTSSIDRNFKNIDHLETALLFSQYNNQSVFISICDQEGNTTVTPSQRLQNNRLFEYVCKNLIGNNDYVEGVYLFTNSGYTYSFLKNREFWLTDPNSDSSWKTALGNKEEASIIQPFVPLHSGSSRKYLLFAKEFRNLSGKASGTIAVICNNSILSQITDSNLDQICILYPDGSLIYNSNEHSRLTFTPEQMSRIQNESSGYIESEDGRIAYTFGTLDNPGWKVVSKISLDSLSNAYHQSRTMLLCVLFLVLVVAAGLVYVSEKSFLCPLVRLAYTMRKTPEEGMHFENSCPNRQDEIGILYRCFERMLQQIQMLIEEKYKSEIRYLKSCLQSLMSQINAHFLFNTLENINCFAEIEKNHKIAVMSKSLGDILRYSIDYETEEVPLSREVEQTKKYISIQEIKFGHPIRFRQEVEGNLLEHPVMKFLLQPIVENAIEHGLSGVANGELVLTAYHKGDTLFLEIADNGSRIPEERLAQVRERICYGAHRDDEVQGKHTSVGLMNIQRRLRLQYSDQYGLTIDNRPEGGVVVQVTLPYQQMQ
ncbi:MAG: hypothetical protein E7518_03205 [Ruminococcaceae bacterium]|nr:hypothetical protein [Oscillospiraceae bacterium]